MKIDTFKVEEWMNEYENYSQYDIANTTVNTLSIDELFKLTNADKSAFLNNLTNEKLGYGHIFGNPRLKAGISKLYKKILPENILPTIGAAGANHLAFYSLVEPNDEVICMVPTYQQLYSIPKSFGAKVKLLHLKKENNFLPDIEELKSLITPNTKLICINNPNNPTGIEIPYEMLKEIANIAKQTNCYILCDEVYRGLNPNKVESTSMADIYEKTISTCSMSKIFSLAGIRLGWIASQDNNIIELCKHHREYNMISCSIIDEEIATLALEHSEKIIKRNNEVIKEHSQILDNWIRNNKHFSYVQPEAGTTALIYYDFKMQSQELCHRLAIEKGVFLTPGDCFEIEQCFRIGYCKNKEHLINGLKKISEFVKENIDE